MSKTLEELIAEKQALEHEISNRQRAERSDAITKIRQLMAQYDLSREDIPERANAPVARAGRSAMAGRKLEAKYRHPQSGDTWTGRGLKPKWLRAELDAGKALESFAV